jgi:pimeloyl-ACP methyl ester carboxylesterase
MKHVKRAILKGCEHWVFEENPTETTPILVEFLLQQSGSTAERPAPSKSQ